MDASEKLARHSKAVMASEVGELAISDETFTTDKGLSKRRRVAQQSQGPAHCL
jgi:hypothetical protein